MSGFTDNSGYWGGQGPYDANDPYLAATFHIRQVLSQAGTTMPVKIVAVTNNGGVSPVGFVDVQPLVNQIDGFGNATPHGILHGLPYSRLQGGSNAIIMDPHVGDMGTAVFSSHDISSVKANKAQANPGSRRRFDMADGIYVPSILNGTPDQYVQFVGDQVNIVATGTINVTAPDHVNIVSSGTISLTAPTLIFNNSTLTAGGDLQVEGNVISHATGVAVELYNHTHGAGLPPDKPS